jgi:hypothetical protein
MSSLESPDGLTKIVVLLPNHRRVHAEAMWARALGNNRYELRNIPFHAYDLNFLDVVEATAASPESGEDPEEERPIVRRVVRRSGRRTVRVSFKDDSLLDERVALLRSLERLDCSFERSNDSDWAIDAWGGVFHRVVDALQVWELNEVLTVESCDARVRDSFDARAV